MADVAFMSRNIYTVPRIPLLAKQIVASIEGGIMMARLTKNEDDLKDCLDSMRALLGM